MNTIINEMYNDATSQWLVDASGQCRVQQPFDKDRELSHTARMRAEDLQVSKTISRIIGYNPEQYLKFQLLTGKAWMKGYLHQSYGDVPERYLVEDVEELFSDPKIEQWWLHQWAIREEWVLPKLAKYKEEKMRILKDRFREHIDAGMPTDALHKSTSDMCREFYMSLQNLSMGSEHREQLINSYAKIYR